MAHHAQEDVRLLAMRGLYLYSSASFVFAIVENGIQPMIKQGTHCMHFCDDDDMNFYFCLFSIQQLTQQLNKCSGSPCSMRCEATSLWPSLQACHAKFGPPQNGPPWNQNSNQIGSPRNQFGCCNWPPLTVLVPPSLNKENTCMRSTSR